MKSRARENVQITNAIVSLIYDHIIRIIVRIKANYTKSFSWFT